MSPTINALYRYPVKGLSPETLERVKVEVGKCLPYDRGWAIEAGTGRFDPSQPKHFPKINFLMLMRDEALAGLTTRYCPDSQILTIAQGDDCLLEACLTSADGKVAVESFFTRYMPADAGAGPRLVRADGFSFSDLADQVISIINLASVRALEKAAGLKVHPLRFRANLYLEGIEPWEEMNWVGKRLRNENGTILEGVKITRRCPAINVNPDTAERDTDLNRVLIEDFGHPNCGIYMKVTTAGILAAGDRLEMV